MLIGDLLGLIFELLLIVLGDLAVLTGFLYRLVCITSYGTNGDSGLFAPLADNLNKLLSALLGKLWENKPYNLSVISRIDAQIGLLYGLLNFLHHRWIPKRNRQHPGFG